MIGQKQLKTFLRTLNIQERIPTEMNILFTGRAGMGKTHALNFFSNILSKQEDLSDCIQHLPKQVSNSLLEQYKGIPIQVIDEVHKVESFEILYPYMERSLFLTGTNIPETLPEAFRSRNINLVMEEYTPTELGRIIYNKYRFPSELVNDLVERSRGTPRDILKMGSLVNLDPQVDLDSLGYFKDGFRTEDLLYLEYLENVGSSSLSRIAMSTNLDKTLIEQKIEPFLINKGLVYITNRRYFNGTN